jgi:hypothetical protein
MRTTYVYANEFGTFIIHRSLRFKIKIGLARSLRMIPEKFFQHIEGTDGLFEIRVK